MNCLQRKNGIIQFGTTSAKDLIEEYGSPLYIYSEEKIRKKCRQIKEICSLPNMQAYYSAKANSSVAILRIIREEGLFVDAMSLGEVYLEKLAGYATDEILFVSNNVQKKDFQELISQNIRVCIDSISQLKLYCSLHPKSKISIRINPGKGDGHHENVITAGKVKFGIEISCIEKAFDIAKEFGCEITGLHSHIGSLFLSSEIFLESVSVLLDLAKKYPQIDFLDFGGGFGIPYNRSNEEAFPIESFTKQFINKLQQWMEETGRVPSFAIEPGRFVVAEAGICLTTVQSVKSNSGIRFVGTDLGFNFLLRPQLYDSYHEIIHATNDDNSNLEKVTVVGNVCESGDNLGTDRMLPKIVDGDVLLIRDTGAYGMSMASNYNSMKRPAELLIGTDGKVTLIRKRETFEDLSRNQVY